MTVMTECVTQTVTLDGKRQVLRNKEHTTHKEESLLKESRFKEAFMAETHLSVIIIHAVMLHNTLVFGRKNKAVCS